MPTLNQIITLDRSSETPLYLQIANAMMHAIRRGLLRRGARLPGTREFASALQVHRKTAQTALDELMAQGWIQIRERRGAFVVRDLPEIKPVRIGSGGALHAPSEKAGFRIDGRRFDMFPPSDGREPGDLLLDDGFPDVRLAPIDLLIREYRSVAKRSSFRKYLQYGGPKGASHLLETLAEYLNDTRRLPITPENLLVTRGAQMGFYLSAMALLGPGDNVVVGEPGYLTASVAFRHAGASINRVRVDNHGIDVDAIERLCARKRIRLVYVIPHHHYPTTVTLTPNRRVRLLELAARHNFAIIEDDYDYDFDYNSTPVLPMASLDDGGNVIYVGTLTKTLVPSIRLGFLAAPRPLINAVARLRRMVDWQGDSLMEVAIAELFRNGAIPRHIRKVVNVYRERRDSFCRLLGQKLGKRVSFSVPQGGMSVWVAFNGVTLPQVVASAAKKGLILSDSRFYDSPNLNVNAARLGFASLNLDEQEKAIGILADAAARS